MLIFLLSVQRRNILIKEQQLKVGMKTKNWTLTNSLHKTQLIIATWRLDGVLLKRQDDFIIFHSPNRHVKPRPALRNKITPHLFITVYLFCLTFSCDTVSAFTTSTNNNVTQVSAVERFTLLHEIHSTAGWKCGRRDKKKKKSEPVDEVWGGGVWSA